MPPRKAHSPTSAAKKHSEYADQYREPQPGTQPVPPAEAGAAAVPGALEPERIPPSDQIPAGAAARRSRPLSGDGCGEPERSRKGCGAL